MKRTVATLLAGLGIILAGAIETAAHNRAGEAARKHGPAVMHLTTAPEQGRLIASR